MLIIISFKIWSMPSCNNNKHENFLVVSMPLFYSDIFLCAIPEFIISWAMHMDDIWSGQEDELIFEKKFEEVSTALLFWCSFFLIADAWGGISVVELIALLWAVDVNLQCRMYCRCMSLWYYEIYWLFGDVLILCHVFYYLYDYTSVLLPKYEL